MSRVLEAVAASIILFVGSLLFDTFTVALRNYNGWYTVGTPVDTNVGRIQFLDIYNQSSSMLGDIIISVSPALNMDEFFSSEPLSIEALPDRGSEKSLFSISQIPPSRLTRIVVATHPNQIGNDDIQMINAEKIGLEEIEANDLPSASIESIRESFLNSVFSAVFMGLIFYFVTSWFDRRVGELRNDFDGRKQYFDENTKEIRDELDRVQRYVDSMRKYTLLEKARIRDLTKELDFWRDTVRKSMVEAGKTLNDSDKLIDIVTTSLKTYSTVREPDFEHVRVLAALLRDAEKT